MPWCFNLKMMKFQGNQLPCIEFQILLHLLKDPQTAFIWFDEEILMARKNISKNPILRVHISEEQLWLVKLLQTSIQSFLYKIETTYMEQPAIPCYEVFKEFKILKHLTTPALTSMERQNKYSPKPQENFKHS